MTDPDNFYARIAPVRTAASVLDERSYVAAPADWWLAVSDIRGSTAAVSEGRHADVNFAAAAMIAALVNLCGTIPYQFGGDGAVALVPPGEADAARRVLARTRGFAAREFGLDLRVGMVPVASFAAHGVRLLVARYEPSPGSAYAVFRGGAIELFERAVKGRGDDGLAAQAAIDDALDDGTPPDLTGLSCRWTPVRAARGRIVTLVLRSGDHAAIHAGLADAAGVPALAAVSAEALEARWPPKGLMREARARRGRVPLPLMVVLVGLETLLAWAIIHFRWRVGRFDAERYVREVAAGAGDFACADRNLYLVFDCPIDRLDAVRAFLDAAETRGELSYGINVSDHAVMTCLVVSAVDGQHVHFVDGGDGGYTSAATRLKARAA